MAYNGDRHCSTPDTGSIVDGGRTIANGGVVVESTIRGSEKMAG
jgi:hypothetical protein